MIFLLNLVAATFQVNLFGLDFNPKININISAPKLFLEDIKAILKLPDGSVNNFENYNNQCLVSKLNLDYEKCSYKSFTVTVLMCSLEYDCIITTKIHSVSFMSFRLIRKYLKRLTKLSLNYKVSLKIL